MAVKGNLRGVRREIVIFSCYIPPKVNKKEVTDIFESLTDAISEGKAKANSPWIVVAGDWNRYDTSSISKLFPDLRKKETGPTRGLPRWTIVIQILKIKLHHLRCVFQ